MSNALKKGDTLLIRMEKHGSTWGSVYGVEVKKNRDEYELITDESGNQVVYKLPANKLELLSEMEVSLKDLRHITQKEYFVMIISSGNKKRSYRLNTDIMHDFITGLKKK